MRYAIAFLLLASTAQAQDKPKKVEVLDLFQFAREEAARKQLYREAVLSSRNTGNNLVARDLLENQDRARSKFLRRKVDGFVLVISVDTLGAENKSRFVIAVADGVQSEAFRCFADEGDDPILRQLKRGDRIRVQGEFTDRLDAIRDCTFTLANVSANRSKAPKKEKAKPVAAAPVSEEEKAAGILKVANALYADGNSALGRNRLEMVIRDFPKTKAAQEAKKTLGQ